MSHAIELPDELYRAVERYAAQRGLTAEAAVVAWAASLATPTATPAAPESDARGAAYDPAQDPLAPFLGTGELTTPDAIRRHDEALAAEALDAHRE